ncbi:hypothetical protein EXIGLDRAFT_845676 [Exidia glandulosa HHB12029]|uniref:F-box domain-containing protein n=1 Tax=Exidia glandulosa HHB12029 TaxID=1314781 RepID=A0A165Z8G6_EXIGL|nr:hypothetical protein EXIGLDRAFT_845676 [Exidia glandulosa HHB12029]
MASASSPLQSRLAALSAAVSGVCDEIFASSADSILEDPEPLWDTLRKSVSTGVAASIRRRNIQRSPVYCMPPELFDMILALLDLKDRLSVARVCSLWKDRSTSCKAALALPTRHDERITPVTSKCFESQLRFLGYPDVQIPGIFLDYDGTDFFCTVAFMHNHMQHIELLDVLIMLEQSGSNRHAALAQCFSTPAPRLRWLQISFESHEAVDSLLRNRDWFAGYAPNLRRCDFWGVAFYTPVFASVRTAYFLIDHRSRLEHIRVLMSEFPCLEALSLEKGGLPSAPSTSPLPVSPILSRLWLDQATVEAFSHVDYDSVRHVTLRSRLPIPIPAAIQRIILQPILTLDIYLQASGRIPIVQSVMLRTSHVQGYTRVFTLSDVLIDDPLRDITVFADATEVSLHNPHLLRDATLPSLLSLRRLTLYVSSALTNVLRGSEFPNLQELIIIFTRAPGSAHPSCHAQDLVHILRPIYQTVQLVIRGANVIEPGLSDLRTRVSSLRIEPNVRVLDADPLWVSGARFENIWTGNVSLTG